MFAAFRRWRRRRVIERADISPALWQRTLDQLPFLVGLSADERERLRELVILFLYTKTVHGAGGLVLDEGMPLLIAAQACILILNLDIEYYDGWVEVIVYPDAFVPTMEYMDEDGIVHRDHAPRAGEAPQRFVIGGMQLRAHTPRVQTYLTPSIEAASRSRK